MKRLALLAAVRCQLQQSVVLAGINIRISHESDFVAASQTILLD
ncbi:hypothetical protein [Nostoc sp. ChiQUE01b]|nr:hypothetical protein [Nostoc sp. ChiQUE01b]MDZ8260668.1 hypothetical protein [Nostoc sp. ChiQUE01b]